MNKSILKPTLVAAAVALSTLAPAAHAAELSRDTGVGTAIAAQGNAALRLIRQDMYAAVRAARPVRPARPRLSAPVGEPRQHQVSNDRVVTSLING